MNAREIVTKRIAEQARRFPDWLNIPLATPELDARDAALAAAIDHAVMRRWLTLAAILQSRLSRPWAEIEFKLQAVMLVGAAQLLFLERLPDHAVINEAVEWAKRWVRPKSGAMVNAVLRKVAALRSEVLPIESSKVQYSRDELPLHDGRIWRLTEPVFDELPLRQLSQQTSHSEALISQWFSVFGPEQAAAVARHSLMQAPLIVHGVSELLQNDAASKDHITPHDQSGFFLFNADRQMFADFLHEHPEVIVQDPTSAAVVKATAQLDPSPQFIIDACAGLGTKTRQLALLHPQATIIATDMAEQRTDILRRDFANHPNVQVIDHQDLLQHAQAADLLLLDVPCSNTGVLARRVEAKYRYSKDTQESLAKLQRQIIADSLALLKPDGRLLYATCSIETTENQQQAQWICKWHPMRVAAEQITLPSGFPGESPQKYHDGGYWALLEKTARR